MLSSVTGLYPWLGYRATDRITVWGVTGYGVGGMLLTPAGGPALESGLTTAMAAAGTRGELVGGGADGFALAFKADVLWAGTAIDGVDGPEGRLAATAAAVTRVRTGLEGSRGFTFGGGGLSLRPSVEVGLRHDGGDAETGAGVDVGGGLVASHASSGLAADVRVRTLLVHEAEGFREHGVSLSLSWNPTPSTPLGLTARVAPSWGAGRPPAGPTRCGAGRRWRAWGRTAASRRATASMERWVTGCRWGAALWDTERRAERVVGCARLAKPPAVDAVEVRECTPRCWNISIHPISADFSMVSHLGAALLRRRPKGLLPAARQELLDPSKAWWGGRRGRLADRPRYFISVSLGVVPLVLPRRGSPSTHRGRGWLRSTRSFRTASAPTKLATRRIRTRAWMKQRYWVAPACTSELHHGRGQVPHAPSMTPVAMEHRHRLQT